MELCDHGFKISTGCQPSQRRLSSGGYEYEATLTRGSHTLRSASGSFTLHEPTSLTSLTSLTGIADAVNAGAVAYTLSDAALSLPGLLPATCTPTTKRWPKRAAPSR